MSKAKAISPKTHMSSSTKRMMLSLMSTAALLGTGMDDLPYQYGSYGHHSDYTPPIKTDQGRFVIKTQGGYLQELEPLVLVSKISEAKVFHSFDTADIVRQDIGGKIRRL